MLVQRHVCIAAAFASVMLVLLAHARLQAADQYSVVVEEGQPIDLLRPDGKPVVRYMHLRDTSTPEQTFDTAKVFAHVLGPDGKSTLTKGPGGKFPHHRGIFIGWNKLQQGGKTHDLWHVRNTAQLHRKVVSTKADEQGATLTTLIEWIGTEGEPVLEETRTYRLVKEDEAYAVVEFVSDLKAVNGDVRLDGDPEHAGVQFRPSQQVAENKSAQYLFHEDGIDPRQQRDLPWVAETFKVDDQAWTVQHMSHPTNPKGARWSAYRDYGRFGPFTVVEIPAGETQTFRYRFRVTEGDAPPREQLDASYQQYAR